MSIMMMSSTSITSTRGVTLMSALTPPLAPPRSIAIANLPEVPGSRLNRNLELWNLELWNLCVLDEVVDELRRGVVHLDVEVLNARRQVVVDPDGRDGDDEAERGLDERFRNTDRDSAQSGRTAGADALERVDDADDRAEQSDERRGGPDGRKGRDA